ncbi:MAG TPA: hypothetical protein PLX89_20715 [Verrucomicrobiota bacterium]|nr:hypothetical protein [Verrucomicrobiales bacterium]HRI15426.1 hypothetical protein [Verrucomicrobiota bacterium]
MSADPGDTLSTLLGPLSRWFGSVPALSRSMAFRQVQDRLGSHCLPLEWRVLPGVRANLHLQLSRKDQRTVLLLFSEKSPDQVIFHTEIAVAVVQTQNPELIRTKIDHCVFRVPKLFNPAPAGTLLVRLGPADSQLLTIEDASKGPEGAKLKIGNKPVTKEDALRLILDFTRSVREWLADPDAGAVDHEVRLPNTRDSSESKQVLAELATGWTFIQQELAQRQPWFTELSREGRSRPASTWDHLLDTPYVLREYGASVELRLKSDGTVADSDNDETVQVKLVLNMLVERGRVVAQVSARPPDFITEGDLSQQIRRGFSERRDLCVEIVTNLRQSGIVATNGRVADLIATAGEASVFRVRRRGSVDTELLVVEGVVSGRDVLVIVVGKIEFSGEGKNETMEVSDCKLLYGGPSGARGPKLGGNEEERGQQFQGIKKWFLHLAVAAERWAGTGMLT